MSNDTYSMTTSADTYKYNFEVGDKVQLKEDNPIDPDDVGWISSMKKLLGKELTIDFVSKHNIGECRYKLRECPHNYWYSKFWLKPSEVETEFLGEELFLV